MTARLITFTHECPYCPKYFNTFNYATAHMNECHQRAMDARGMTYPLLLRAERRFSVHMEPPKKKGYLRNEAEQRKAAIAEIAHIAEDEQCYD